MFLYENGFSVGEPSNRACYCPFAGGETHEDNRAVYRYGRDTLKMVELGPFLFCSGFDIYFVYNDILFERINYLVHHPLCCGAVRAVFRVKDFNNYHFLQPLLRFCTIIAQLQRTLRPI